MVQLPWRTVWRLPKKLKTELPNEPAIPLLGICLEKTIIQKEGALHNVHCTTIYNNET